MAKILIGKYEATIYPEDGRVTGALSLGCGPDGKRKRLKRKGRNKTEVIDKLIQAVKDLESGIEGQTNYTVRDAVEDWLTKGLKGRDPETITTNRILAEKHVLPLIGKAKLKDLRADDVDTWLDGLTDKLSTRSLQGVHSILKRAIRQAQARDKVLRNVAELVTAPKGRPGRPSKALTRPTRPPQTPGQAEAQGGRGLAGHQARLLHEDRRSPGRPATYDARSEPSPARRRSGRTGHRANYVTPS